MKGERTHLSVVASATDAKAIQAAGLLFSGCDFERTAEQMGIEQRDLESLLASPRTQETIARFFESALFEVKTLVVGRLPRLIELSLDAIEGELTDPLATGRLSAARAVLNLAARFAEMNEGSADVE